MDEESETKYGNCDGPDSQYIKMISSDGLEFIIKREYALLSGTIKAMLSGPGQFTEMEANVINFRSIPSHVLRNVCTYLTYKDHYTKYPAGMVDFNIEPEISLELLMAANFLDC